MVAEVETVDDALQKLFADVDRHLDDGDMQSAYKILKEHVGELRGKDKTRFEDLVFGLPPELRKKFIVESSKVKEDQKQEDSARMEDEKMAPIEKALEADDFIGADEAFRKAKGVSGKRFLERKGRAVIEWFEQHVKDAEGRAFELDHDQALAVVSMNKNMLITARAGSGKTRTIVAKMIFLTSCYQIKPSEMLCFVFNRDARKEINDRLQAMTVDGLPVFHQDVATTFHAFARTQVCVGVAREEPKILVNDRARFIQGVLHEVPGKDIYEFFRDEMFKIPKEKGLAFLDEKSYYDLLRNMQYRTLDGGFVKSLGEKIICDYLFEHDIKYRYEPEFYYSAAKKVCLPQYKRELRKIKDNFNEDSIKPDFVIEDKKGVCHPWEHWGIRGNETPSERSEINESGEIGDYNEYYKKMKWKQWFYEKSWLDKATAKKNKWAEQIAGLAPLIETHFARGQSREEFENKISRVLAKHGISAEKLPEEELIKRVWEKQIKYFTEMIERFIDRAQQQFPGDDGFLELEKKIKDFHGDERTRAFYRVGLKCYKLYMDYLSGKKNRDGILKFIKKYFIKSDIKKFKDYDTDFNIVMHHATDLIDVNNDMVQKLLSRKKIILVDEYQDFSPLFYKMILKIREVCPDASLFAVGDDYQAINRFAGSDVGFFIEFQKYFPEDVKKVKILNNYRSRPKIVGMANDFTNHTLGSASAKATKEGGSRIELIDPRRISWSFKSVYSRVLMNRGDKYPPRKIEVQYLREVAEIVEEAWNRRDDDSDEKVLILHRKNELYCNPWRSIEEFGDKLKRVLVQLKKVMTDDEFKKFVEVCTVHRSKGREAETVILLEVDSGTFPIIHPDTMLYQIFGDTLATSLEDQQRLFYVALTRAKRNLHIFHMKKQRDQSFVKDLSSKFYTEKY